MDYGSEIADSGSEQHPNDPYIEGAVSLTERCALRFASHFKYVAPDEAISEALVVLADEGRKIEAEDELSFRKQLAARLRLRLYDWLRRDFGRKGTPKFEATMSAMSTSLPLDGPIASSTTTFQEVLGVCPSAEDTVLDDNNNGWRFHRWMATLNERERYIIVESYLNGRPLSEIANEFGVTESRACQIRMKALNRMRIRADTLIEC